MKTQQYLSPRRGGTLTAEALSAGHDAEIEKAISILS